MGGCALPRTWSSPQLTQLPLSNMTFFLILSNVQISCWIPDNIIIDPSNTSSEKMCVFRSDSPGCGVQITRDSRTPDRHLVPL